MMGGSSASGIPPCQAPAHKGELISLPLQLPSEQAVVPGLLLTPKKLSQCW